MCEESYRTGGHLKEATGVLPDQIGGSIKAPEGVGLAQHPSFCRSGTVGTRSRQWGKSSSPSLLNTSFVLVALSKKKDYSFITVCVLTNTSVEEIQEPTVLESITLAVIIKAPELEWVWPRGSGTRSRQC